MSARILGHLEQPATGAVSQERLTGDGRLLVAGWAFATEPQPVTLCASVNGIEVAEALADRFREDVGRSHPDVVHAGRSGFALMVPLPPGGRAHLTVEAKSRSARQPLGERLLEVPASLSVARGCGDPEARPRRRPANARRRRVLLVSHNFNLEGAPRSLHEIGSRLDRERFRVQVVSPADGPMRSIWRESGIEAQVLPFIPGGRTLGDFEAAVRRVAALLGRFRPDVVVANTLETYWAVEVARELGVPCDWIVRESVDPSTYFFERLALPVAERAGRCFRSARRVLFVARATERLFADAVPAAGRRVIPNGLDLAGIDAQRRRWGGRGRLRRRLDLPAGGPILLCVGTACPRKGQHVLVHALARLVAAHPDVRCVLLGVQECSYLEAVQEAADRLGVREHLRIEPETPDPLPFYAAADLFVCPSFQESLPRVVMEAMAFSLPVVATDVHGIPELVRDEREGRLVAAGDVGQLSSAIDGLLRDPARGRRLGAAARRRVEAHFRLDRVARQWEELLTDALAGASAA